MKKIFKNISDGKDKNIILLSFMLLYKKRLHNGKVIHTVSHTY